MYLCVPQERGALAPDLAQELVRRCGTREHDVDSGHPGHRQVPGVACGQRLARRGVTASRRGWPPDYTRRDLGRTTWPRSRDQEPGSTSKGGPVCLRRSSDGRGYRGDGGLDRRVAASWRLATASADSDRIDRPITESRPALTVSSDRDTVADGPVAQR